MNEITWRSLGALILTALALTGCGTTGQFAAAAVKTNLVQEQAHNELLLLNIIRASERKPLHFTQVTAVRMPVGLANSSFSLPIPMGPDRTRLYTLSPELSINQGVDTTVLNSQEFMKGITSPVPPSTLLYYLNQGWQQQLVLHLFVRAVEFYDGDKLVERVVNYPANADQFKKFQTLMQSLRDCEIDSSPEVDRTFYSPKLETGANGRQPHASLLSLEALAALKAAGLTPVAEKDDPRDPQKALIRFAAVSRSPGFELSDRPGAKCPGLESPQKKISTLKVVPPTPDGKANAGPSARLVLRSPEAMIYFLGEIVRERAARRNTASGSDPFPEILLGPLNDSGCAANGAGCTHTSVAFFRMDQGSPPEGSMSASYDGRQYFVPKSSTDRSAHVLSLLTQIIALQNKGTESPTTTNVRVLPP